MEIRAATRADVIELCGESYPQSMRALVVEHNGESVAIAGVLHTDPMQCFSVIRDAVRQSPKTIIKTAKRLRRILDGYKGEIYAIASKEEPTAPRFLEHVGFNYFRTNSQGRIYKWPKQSPS